MHVCAQLMANYYLESTSQVSVSRRVNGNYMLYSLLSPRKCLLVTHSQALEAPVSQETAASWSLGTSESLCSNARWSLVKNLSTDRYR